MASAGPGTKVPPRARDPFLVLPITSRSEMRWVLAEAADQILPEVISRCP